MHTKEEVWNELRRLDKLLGIDTRYITLTISNRAKKQYGCCVGKFNQRTRRYVPDEIRISGFMLNEEDALWDTVRHEYAHAVSMIRSGKNHGHDDYWKSICREVGAKSERLAETCTSAQRVYERRPVKYSVKCDKCGKVFQYSRRTKFIDAVIAGKQTYFHSCGGNSFTLLTDVPETV